MSCLVSSLRILWCQFLLQSRYQMTCPLQWMEQRWIKNIGEQRQRLLWWWFVAYTLMWSFPVISMPLLDDFKIMAAGSVGVSLLLRKVSALESIYEFCAVFVGHSSDPLLLLLHVNVRWSFFLQWFHGDKMKQNIWTQLERVGRKSQSCRYQLDWIVIIDYSWLRFRSGKIIKHKQGVWRLSRLRHRWSNAR